jgi:hypothetical protein
MAKKPPATGSIPANFHEAARSEYLAQYVFTMFGTSVLVPRQEDYGVVRGNRSARSERSQRMRPRPAAPSERR